MELTQKEEILIKILREFNFLKNNGFRISDINLGREPWISYKKRNTKITIFFLSDCKIQIQPSNIFSKDIVIDTKVVDGFKIGLQIWEDFANCLKKYLTKLNK